MKTSGRKTVKAATTSAPRASKLQTASVPAAAATLATVDAMPSSTDIARRSHELYLARGGTDGHDVEDWLQAEAELRFRH